MFTPGFVRIFGMAMVVAAVVLLLLAVAFLPEQDRPSTGAWRFLSAAGISALIALGPIYFTTGVMGGTVWFDSQWRGVANRTERVVWNGDELLQRKQLNYARRDIDVTSVVSPITDNPKVRRIRYAVTLDVLGTPEQGLVYYPYVYRTSGWMTEQDWLHYRLNIFNNEHSKELANFFNDRDPEQQKKFWALISVALDDDLKRSGAKLIHVSFDLE